MTPSVDTTRDAVILVDEHGQAIGQTDKMEAHRTGTLHRAFSVFVFNTRGELLLQQRAHDKYHSAGLWTNTCCSHPRPGEATEAAAHRRLQEEMGFDCPLTEVFSLIYKTALADLYEHEYDHIFVGRYDGDPVPNPGEVAAWRWAPVATIAQDLTEHPERYTHWFHLAFDTAVARWKDLE
jgi:isopentenyl-diphosphate delta-isomerase